jgi:hypothetical protein
MINHIIALQRHFRMKQQQQHFNELKYSEINSLSFASMSEWATRAKNMVVVRRILNNIFLKSIAKKDVRSIMASFMIHHYPNEILNSPEENNIIETNICNYSKNIVTYINKLQKTTNRFEYNLYTHKLKKFIEQYLEYFPIWKNIDKLFLLKNLYELYYEYEEFKNKNNTQPIITADINFQQLNLIARINEISNDNCQLNKQLDDVYWTLLKEEIKADKYERFLTILTDIKQLICSILPSRIDIHKEIDEIIDIEYIAQMAKHDAIEPSYIFNMINYLLDKVAMLQAAADDKNFNKWKIYLMDQLGSNIHYYDFFPPFFRILIKRLEHIYIESNKFRKQLEEAKNKLV